MRFYFHFGRACASMARLVLCTIFWHAVRCALNSKTNVTLFFHFAQNIINYLVGLFRLGELTYWRRCTVRWAAHSRFFFCVCVCWPDRFCIVRAALDKLKTAKTAKTEKRVFSFYFLHVASTSTKFSFKADLFCFVFCFVCAFFHLAIFRLCISSTVCTQFLREMKKTVSLIICTKPDINPTDCECHEM